MCNKIDNLELVKKHLKFVPSLKIYYFIQVIQRRKENPDLSVGEIQRHCVWITSLDDLNNRWPRIVTICEHYNARAYISLVPRSLVKFGRECLLEYSKRICSGQFDKIYDIPKKVAQGKDTIQTKGVISKPCWILDIDTKDSGVLSNIESSFKDISRIVEKFQTKNGYHYMIEAFNPKKIESWCVSKKREDYKLPDDKGEFTLRRECNTILYASWQ